MRIVSRIILGIAVVAVIAITGTCFVMYTKAQPTEISVSEIENTQPTKSNPKYTLVQEEPLTDESEILSGESSNAQKENELEKAIDMLIDLGSR